MMRTLDEILKDEANFADSTYGAFNSPHEAYGVMKEEFEEWWDSIKNNKMDLYELLQVVAVGYRYLQEQTDRDNKKLGNIFKAQIKRWKDQA